MRCCRILSIIAVMLVFWGTRTVHAATVFETKSIYLAGQGPSGASSNSPQVTLYSDLNHIDPSHIVTQATVSEGGAVDWSKVSHVSGAGDYTFIGNPLVAPDSTKFLSFCVELTQEITLGSTYKVDVISLASAPIPTSGPIGASGMGNTAAGLIEQLWSDHFHDVFYTGSTPNSTASQNANAAAFQLAIWKLEYDGGKTFDFSSGYLRVTSHLSDPSVTLATTWLKNIKSTDPRTNLLAITGHNGVAFQDQVVALPPGQTPPPGSVVPEPSSLLLCTLGVLGMAAARRARRRNSNN